jgi:hypothetical protein
MTKTNGHFDRGAVRPRWPLWAGLALLGLLALAPETQAGRKVRVSVLLILATETDNRVDPKLRCIASEVKKMYPKLTGFHQAKLSCKSVEVGVKDITRLCCGKSIAITIQRADKKNRIVLKVAPPSMGEITYSTPCGKFLPIVTRIRTRNNELVIIAIRVQPCKAK